jgi:peptide/nickel transport system substrate-binding protein
VKKLIITLVILTLCAITIAGCAKPAPATPPAAPAAPAPAAPAKPATPAAPQPQYGGILKTIGVGGPTVFGYPVESDPISATAGRIALETLFYLDNQASPLPRLATAWELSADGKSLTVKLRQGVKFHDGTDFNADAAKWNLDNEIALKRIEPIKSVTVVDPYTIRLEMSQYSNVVFPTLAMGGSFISPTAVQKNGKEWARTNPVGTGPFKFVEFKRDVSLKYEKFADYWEKGRPYLDGYETYYFADQTTAAIAFEAGQAHMFTSTSAKVAADLRNKGFTVRGMPGMVFLLASDSANSDSPFFNKKVREAVEYAIDKASIVNAIGYGFMYPTNQLCPKEYLGYNTDIQGRNYDPAKAKALLTEAGYPTGFKTKLMARNTDDQNAIVAIQTFLNAVGIDATLDITDRARYEDTRAKGWKNGLIYGATGADINMNQRISADLGVGVTYWVSLARPAQWQPALNESIAAVDVAARKAKMGSLMKVGVDEAFVTPLWVSNDTGAIAKGVNVDYLTFHKIMWKHTEAWLSK